ncbi:2-hydroxychromene-2-carboxylate isomerase [Marinobacterium aestuariivivens]|uniref:2-hydroxychromene-2-carboxylate isomerase n=1 Tax=Marinobacterium aestuariivivens TaxID=1698799 RepID=A0ABW2A3B8_9GAMM
MHRVRRQAIERKAAASPRLPAGRTRTLVEKACPPLNLQPRFFPADPSLADRCIIALQEARQDPAAFVEQVLTACWQEDRNIADPDILLDLLEHCGQDGAKVMLSAEADEIAAIYDSNTEQAIEFGILGVPAYVFNGEQFWGQDRLELLADALTEINQEAT